MKDAIEVVVKEPITARMTKNNRGEQNWRLVIGDQIFRCTRQAFLKIFRTPTPDQSDNSTLACALSPTEVIQKIAEHASQVGFHSGTASMEGAGQIVSILAVNPELIDEFLADPHECVWQNEIMWHAQNGCLTWYARGSGPGPKIVSPEERAC